MEGLLRHRILSPVLRNVRVLLAYDGAQFYGWQRQEGFESVQQAMEEALEPLVRQRTVVHGAGRTDTGVHALGQVASFHADTRLDDGKLLFALNAHLPAGIAVQDLETCPDDFHAQRSARGKRYGYLVRLGPVRPPFGRAHSHWVPHALDLGAMRQAARAFLGERDFSAVANAGSPRRSNVRRIGALHLFARRRALGVLIQGDGFLYNMVRTIVGTLLDVGRGKLAAGAVPAILSAGDRREAGPTAPAEGLYLLSVLYPEPCFLRRRRRSWREGGPPGAGAGGGFFGTRLV
ncbi:MAG: tRNA pseudouridine(38-40) synthase TruA [Planctomycetota bacterium]